MGCGCSKKTDVVEPVLIEEIESVSNSNILDSPFSKSILKERDGTLTIGQIPKDVSNAYEKLLEEQNFFDINESFSANPVRVNPFMEPYKEVPVSPSKYLVADEKYYKPPVNDIQPQYLLDMQERFLSIFDIHSGQVVIKENPVFSSRARAIFLPSNLIFICGGKKPRSTYSMSLDHEELQILDNLFEGREYHSLAYINSLVLASGGMGYEELASCEIFFNGKWSATGSLNNRRSFHTSIGLDGCFYVCGGKNSKTIEKWQDGYWETLNISLPSPIGRMGISPVTAYSFLVVGGEKVGVEYIGNVWEVDIHISKLTPLQGLSKIGFFESPGSFIDNTCVFFMGQSKYAYIVNNNKWIIN